MRTAITLLLVGTVFSGAAIVAVRPQAGTSSAREAAILAHVKALASDEMDGRLPGTPGEARTVRYLEQQFKRIGLAPGNPDGTYVQAVPLIGFTGAPSASFTAGGQRIDLSFPDDYVAVSRRGQEQIAVTDSELVFVGYGVVAPEFSWDDYKGENLGGRTLIMLVGDPPVPDPKNPAALDPATFKGPAMTYYGRWPYKFEIGNARGAAAVIIVHETGPAGYGYDVVRNMGRENFNVDAPDLARRHAAIDAWMTLERARQLFERCGLDFGALKARAATRGFTPVALKATFTASVRNTIRRVRTQNVIARLEGRDPSLRAEHVMYSAHWDHFGRNLSFTGDQILNGALDNASGMAEMLAIAERLATMSPRPKRSFLFFSPTAEESAMLGAKYYAQHPLWPLETTLADINMDIMNFWGRTRAIVSVGHGMTTLDEVLAAEAERQGRVVWPDPEPEKGYFYRSDHFELAKLGVPALHFLHPGADYRDKPADYGQRMRDRYTTNDYHKVTDDVKADWDLSGAVEDVDLLAAVGAVVANGASYPAWKPGTEFKAIRDRGDRGRDK